MACWATQHVFVSKTCGPCCGFCHVICFILSPFSSSVAHEYCPTFGPKPGVQKECAESLWIWFWGVYIQEFLNSIILYAICNFSETNSYSKGQISIRLINSLLDSVSVLGVFKRSSFAKSAKGSFRSFHHLCSSFLLRFNSLQASKHLLTKPS